MNCFIAKLNMQILIMRKLFNTIYLVILINDSSPKNENAEEKKSFRFKINFG